MLRESKDVIVATKGGCVRPNGDWEVDGRPDSLKKACEKSLKDLGVDEITLYQLHAVDPNVPFEDSVGALKNLQQEGKILHIGLSNVSSEQLKKGLQIVHIESVQNQCNLFSKRDFKNGLIDLCKELGVTYIPYSPVGGHFGHVKAAKHPLLVELAQKYHCSAPCIMLAWLLTKGDHILPIPGAKRIESATNSPKAIHLRLSQEDIQKLDQI